MAATDPRVVKLANAYVEKARVIADTIELIGANRPDMIERLLDDLHEHDRSVLTLFASIEAMLREEVEWETFVAAHPELK